MWLENNDNSICVLKVTMKVNIINRGKSDGRVKVLARSLGTIFVEREKQFSLFALWDLW